MSLYLPPVFIFYEQSLLGGGGGRKQKEKMLTHPNHYDDGVTRLHGRDAVRWVMGCAWFPSDTALLYFSRSWIEVWFHQTIQSFASWFHFLSSAFMVLPSYAFSQEWLLSGLVAIKRRFVRNPSDCCPSKISRCNKLQYVVLPEQSVGPFSDQSSSLDLLWRFLSVVRTPALVRWWVGLLSFHLVMMESCVIWAVVRLFLYLSLTIFPILYNPLDFLARLWLNSHVQSIQGKVFFLFFFKCLQSNVSECIRILNQLGYCGSFCSDELQNNNQITFEHLIDVIQEWKSKFSDFSSWFSGLLTQ